MVVHISAGKLVSKMAFKREIEVGSGCTGCSQSTFFQRLHDLETIGYNGNYCFLPDLVSLLFGDVFFAEVPFP